MEAVAGSKRRADEAGLPRDADRSTKVSRVEGVSPTEADEGAGDNSHIPKDVALLLDEVAKERATLESNAHPGYNERCAVFEGRRVTELARAVALRDLQRHNIDMLYEYAKYAADKVFEESKRKLRDLMLAELEERSKHLKERVAGSTEQKQEKARKLRSRGKDEVGGGVAAPPPTASQSVSHLLAGTESGPSTILASGIATGVLPGTSVPGAAGAFIMLGVEGMPPPLHVALAAPDIMTDLKHIYRDWRAAAQRWRSSAATALLPARVERGKLHYCNETFAKGDNVTVFSELTKQEYYGTMHLLSAAEVIVRLSDDTKARVPLQHLRHGRVSLYKVAAGAGLPPMTSEASGGGGGVSSQVPPGGPTATSMQGSGQRRSSGGASGVGGSYGTSGNSYAPRPGRPSGSTAGGSVQQLQLQLQQQQQLGMGMGGGAGVGGPAMLQAPSPARASSGGSGSGIGVGGSGGFGATTASPPGARMVRQPILPQAGYGMPAQARERGAGVGVAVSAPPPLPMPEALPLPLPGAAAMLPVGASTGGGGVTAAVHEVAVAPAQAPIVAPSSTIEPAPHSTDAEQPQPEVSS